MVAERQFEEIYYLTRVVPDATAKLLIPYLDLFLPPVGHYGHRM